MWHDLCAGHEGEKNGWTCCGGRVVSPRRAQKRTQAAAAMERQADRMKRRCVARDGHDSLPVGTVVQLALEDVDRAKLDNMNATLVVVEQVQNSYRVANRSGVYSSLVSRANLRPVPNTTAQLVGLANVELEWGGMPRVGIRRIAASLSHAGGQGMLKCTCYGDCTTGRCACVKANRLCNSRCHKANSSCKNCERATNQAGEQNE